MGIFYLTIFSLPETIYQNNLYEKSLPILLVPPNVFGYANTYCK